MLFSHVEEKMQGMPFTVLELLQGTGSVSERLAGLHQRVLQNIGAVDRIACVLKLIC